MQDAQSHKKDKQKEIIFEFLNHYCSRILLNIKVIRLMEFETAATPRLLGGQNTSPKQLEYSSNPNGKDELSRTRVHLEDLNRAERVLGVKATTRHQKEGRASSRTGFCPGLDSSPRIVTKDICKSPMKEQHIFSDPSQDPTPIGRTGIKIVKEIQLGSIWNPKDPNTEMLKLLFVPETHIPTEEIQKCKTSHRQEIFPRSMLKHTSALVPPTTTKTTLSPSDLHCDSVTNSRDDKDRGVSGMELTSEQTTPNKGKKKQGISYKPEMWHERFQELLRYGHTLVPDKWELNKQLSQWVKRQRYQFKLRQEGKHSTLTTQRMIALEEIGFVWSSHQSSWEDKSQQLVEYAKLRGHCNVPSNQSLGIWVKSQRRNFQKLCRGDRRSSMTKDRITRLLSLGFTFRPDYGGGVSKSKADDTDSASPDSLEHIV